MKQPLGAVALIASVALALSACGSGSSSEGSGTGASADGRLQAKERLDERIKTPTDIGITTPLSKKPEPGKTIVRLLPAVPIQQQISEGNKKAAEALGWTYRDIQVSADADGAQKAFQSALDRKPDGIAYGAYPAATLQPYLDKAKAAGIAVVVDSTLDPLSDTIPVMLDGSTEQVEWAKDLAAYVAGSSKTNANVAIFSVSAFPILKPVVDSFRSELKKYCSGCKTTVVDQTVGDIGTKTPQSVVSTLQRDPKIDYILFTFGDLASGVTSALETAGLSKQAKVIGSAVSQAALQNLRDKKDAAWVGLPPDILGWRAVDAFARIFNGDDLSVVNKAILPSQILTQDNIDDAVLDENGFYNAVDGYQAQFKKLWRVE